MSFLKNSKIWAGIALIASLACVFTMVYALMGVREGWEGASFSKASETIRTALEIGVGIFVFSIIVLILGRKTNISMIISASAALLVGLPVIIALSAQPKETAPAPTTTTGQQAATSAAMGGRLNGMGASPGGGRTPSLNDISTDTLDPPQFKAVASVRPEGSNTLQYPENGSRLQKQLFPNIAPIKSDLSKSDAFERALALSKKKGWEIIATDESTGIIEAVSSTFFFSYEDDVVIRVRAQGSGSIIDIRSHSRIGRGDRGKNAERVQDYINRF